jgi:hypothetical protein
MTVTSENLSATSSEVSPGWDEVDDFELRLSSRTKVPAERLSDFLGWDEEHVRQEAKVVSRILKRFAGAVVQSMEKPESMNNFLSELDLKSISRDHDWRAIFSTVRAHKGEDSEQYKRAVLIKYLQYLSFRKRLLDFIHSRKAGLEETDELSVDLTHLPRAAQSKEDSSVVRLGVAATRMNGFARVPLGETVEIALHGDDAFCFLLGRHRFELVGGARPYVVDTNGVTCFVRPGRNMMGRHPESDLTVDANFGDVSRAHLVLEWDGVQRFRLMDLSSRGTWLPSTFLDKLDLASGPEDLLEPAAFG